MTSKSTSYDNGDSRLEQVLAAYLHSVEAGKPLAPDEVIARHPELADALRSYFDNRQAMENLVAPLKGAAEEPTIGMPQGSANASSGTRVRYLGDYELLEEIARGGMGVVYKSRQVSLNRIVAVGSNMTGPTTRIHRRDTLVVLPIKCATARRIKAGFQNPSSLSGRTDRMQE